MTLEEIKAKRLSLGAEINSLTKDKDVSSLSPDEKVTLTAKMDEDDNLASQEKEAETASALKARVDSWKSKPSGPAVIVKPAKGKDQVFEGFSRLVRGQCSNAEFANVLQQGNDALGGYLSAESIFYNTLIRDLEAATPLLSNVRYLPDLMGSDRAVFASLVATVADGYWGGETDSIEASGVGSGVFGNYELQPALVSKWLPVSRKLEAMGNEAAITLIGGELVRALGRTVERGFATGDGAEVSDGGNKPIGIFVANDSGIPTSRDYTTAATGKVQPKDLIGLGYNVESQYWPGSCYMVCPALFAQMREWTDGAGRYLFTGDRVGDLISGAAGTFNGSPVIVVPSAPNTPNTSATYPAAFGNPKNYWVLQHRNIGIERLDQVESLVWVNQFALMIRRYITGAPMIPASWSRLKVK